jgi:hypothetical protein
MVLRRRRLLVVVLAAVVVLVGASVGVWSTQRQVPVVVDPACPPLLTNTSNGLDDYADLVTWGGNRYVGAAAYDDTPKVTEVRAGAVLGLVTCSFSSMSNDRGWSVAPGPWPDGTATGLERGTPLRAVEGRAPGRALLAQTAEGDRLYCLADAETLDARC